MPPKKQKALIILGMHRSGTSAVTRACNLLGVELGDVLMPAQENNNEKGFWEHDEIVALHESLLDSLGSSWDDTRTLPEGWQERPEAVAMRGKLAVIVKRDFANVPLWGIKDPRMCVLLPLWLDILEELDIEPLFLIALRAPNNVAKSLQARDEFARQKAFLLWTRYNLEAEKYTREHKRTFITFNEFSNDWKASLQGVAKALGLVWPIAIKEAQAEIDSFIEPSLVHHTARVSFTCDNKKITEWTKETYRILSLYAEDPKESEATELNRIFKELVKATDEAGKFSSFWFEEAVLWRGRNADLYKTLHERNLDIIEQQKALLEANERLTKIEEKRHRDQVKMDEMKWRVEVLNNTLAATYSSTSWKITAPIRLLKKIYVNRSIIINPEAYKRLMRIYKSYGIKGVLQKVKGDVLVFPRTAKTLQEWFDRYRPDSLLLQLLRGKKWPEGAPKISVLMGVYNTRPEWLHEAIDSVIGQTYTNWELVCVNDASTEKHVKKILDQYAKQEPRIKVIHLPENKGVAAASNEGLKQCSGEHVCFMDHDDILELHALHRVAEAILHDGADIIYSDEISTEENINKVQGLTIRPQFSYDFYITHPYFVHLITIRKSILDTIKGFDESYTVSQDYDLVLRAIEHAKKVSHIADFLYRWRTFERSLGHENQEQVEEASIRALQGHMQRIGFANAEVKPGKHFNFYDIDFGIKDEARVAIIIPTKDKAHLLSTCIESLDHTIGSGLEVDIYVVDHESEEESTKKFLEILSSRLRIIHHTGPFNFSEINNKAVEQLDKDYTHYLFLNNDIEAMRKGWLEHMVGLAKREDVGVVGSLLLYPNQDIQHAGVLVGVHGAAEHSHKFEGYMKGNMINRGFCGSLLANRDYSAVTAACMLVRADAFHKVNGYDEKLAVGFGDTDLCLRIGKAGYKILMDTHAVLIHHESVSRGKSEGFVDPHPEDSTLFITRYKDIIRDGDPFYSPLLSPNSAQFEVNQSVRSSADTPIRTIKVQLPKPPDQKGGNVVKIKEVA